MFNKSIDVLSKALGATFERHNVISRNIANVNTPNYRARAYRFDEAFRAALRGGNVDGALRTQGEIVEDKTQSAKSDGNSVHLENEFGRMQKNAMANNLYRTLLMGKIQKLSMAIKGRGR